jgi:hypothetical protein
MSEDKVPYDENAWERIVADLSDEMPVSPAPAAAPEPVEEEEEGYTPPEPPPLPRMDVVTRLAWIGALGGPLLLFAGVLLPSVVSSTAVTVGIAAFIGGFLTLVLRHPNEPEDGWDDGSVV